MVQLYTTAMLIEGGRPADIEEVRRLSRRGMSMLENLAVIAAEDDLCGHTNGRSMNIEQVTFWRRAIELFGRWFSHSD